MIICSESSGGVSEGFGGSVVVALVVVVGGIVETVVVVVVGVGVKVVCGEVVGGSVGIVICVGVGTVGGVGSVVGAVLFDIGINVIVGCEVLGGAMDVKVGSVVGRLMLVCSPVWHPDSDNVAARATESAGITFTALLNTTRL